MSSRDDANARQAADGRQRLLHAMFGLRGGVSGWWRVDYTAQDGVLLPPVPSYCGVAWEEWHRTHDTSRTALSETPLAWPFLDRLRFFATAQLFDQIVDRLTAVEYFGSAWLRVAGDGYRLTAPDHGLTQTLPVALHAPVR